MIMKNKNKKITRLNLKFVNFIKIKNILVLINKLILIYDSIT